MRVASRRARTLLVVLPLLASCSGGGDRACPAYKAFDGVFLDYRTVKLTGFISGRVCLDDDCRSLREWTAFSGGGQGRLNLSLDRERKDVRLRVELDSDGTGNPVSVDKQIELLPVYNADRECGVYGYSRQVKLDADGRATLGAATRDGAGG